MKADFDAIAVGGGLAGSAFALTLAGQGLRVAVIERTPQARLKVCGDFLSREAQQLLSGIGIDVWSMGAHRISTFRLASKRNSADAPLPFDAAGLSRLNLDEVLLHSAKSAGAEIIRGEGVNAIEPCDLHVKLQCGQHSLTAANVGLATGKHNIRGLQRPAGGPTAFKISFELSPNASKSLNGIVQLVSYKGGYIGACNNEYGATTVCWLADRALMQRTGGSWSNQLDAFSRESPHIGDLLIDAKPQTEKPATVSAIPYGYLRKQEIDPRVFPLGDQMAVIPSFTGDGTSIALASGIAAAEIVLTGQPAGQFQKAFGSHLRRQFLMASAIDASFKSAFTRYMSVKAIGAWPGLATGLTRMTRMAEFKSH